jgi:hypothetical protein
VRPRAFANPGDRNRVRLRVLRVGHRRVTRLPERGYVIDVYAESKGVHRWNR